MVLIGVGIGIWLQGSPPLVQAQPSVPMASLPPGLVNYRYDPAVGDYLDQLWHNERGEYVRWTSFPIKIYIQPNNAQWMMRVSQAIRQWTDYVPLQRVGTAAQAQIRVEKDAQELNYSGKARAFFDISSNGKLQCWVRIRIYKYLGLSEVGVVALHEIGHALGMWGHSSDPRDLMYGGDAAAMAPSWQPDFFRIGPRDLNTLKRLYEQPSVIDTEISEVQQLESDPDRGLDRSVLDWDRDR